MLQDTCQPNERPSQISEQVEKLVQSMTLQDIIDEVSTLRSNARFHDSLYTWLLREIRNLEIPDNVYWYLKEDLNDNMHKIVELFELEDKFRERVIEYWTDQRINDLE